MKDRKWLGAIIVGILLAATIALFALYVNKHPGVIHALSGISPGIVVLLLLMYAVMLFVWMGVYNSILALCARPLELKENMLLSIYSTLANFFLPLQSGPGVRAAYLKAKHKVPVANYILATLIYFAFYALIAAIFMFAFSNYWYLTLPAVVIVALTSAAVFYIARKKFFKNEQTLTINHSLKKFGRLFLLTFLQLSLQTLIYGTELKSLHLQFSPLRAFSYTGAASFSLFVSLTPGAIGFREGFLKLSQSLHHFSTNNIIAANLIDRGVFLIFLAILFMVMLATHARDKIKV